MAKAEIKSKTTILVMIDEGLCDVRQMRKVVVDRANSKLMKCSSMYPAMKQCEKQWQKKI